MGVILPLRLSLVILSSRAHRAVERERNKSIAKIDALILTIERTRYDTCMKAAAGLEGPFVFNKRAAKAAHKVVSFVHALIATRSTPNLQVLCRCFAPTEASSNRRPALH